MSESSSLPIQQDGEVADALPVMPAEPDDPAVVRDDVSGEERFGPSAVPPHTGTALRDSRPPRPHRLSSGQRVALVACLALLAPFLFLSDFLLLQKVLYYFDLEVQWVPFQQFLHNSREVGQSPVWNPYIMLGFPQLAEAQAGIFYPFNLLLNRLANQPHALAISLYLHLVIAFASTYGLARACRLERLPSVLAAISFAFSGFLFAQITNYDITLVGVYLPLKLYLITQHFKRSDARWLLFFALASGVELLVSHANMSFITSASAGMYCFLLAMLRGRRAFRDLTLYVFFSLLGILLAAVQLLPTQEFVAFSDRSGGISYEGVTSYSHGMTQYLTAFFPMLFGAPSIGYSSGGSFEELYFFVGSFVVVLALSGVLWLLRRDDNHTLRMLAALGLVGFLISLGANNPFVDLYQWLIHVPGFNLFRAPARWSLIPTLALAVLAGYGLQKLIAATRAGKPWQALASLVAPAIAAPVFFFWMGRADKDVEHETVTRNLTSTREADFGQIDWIGQQLYAGLTQVSPLAYFAIVLGICVLFVPCSRRLPARTCAIILVILAFVDILAVVKPLNTRMPSDYYEAPGEHIARLKRDAGLHRAASPSELPNLQGVNNSMGGYFGIQSVHGYTALRLRRYERLSDALGRPEIQDFVGVKYEIFDPGEGRYTLAERQNVLPRAFLLQRYEYRDNGEDALSAFLDSEDEIRRTTAFLSMEQARRIGLAIPAALADVSPTPHLPVDIVRYENTRVTMRGQAPGPAFLVLTDMAYPGWTASVNGVATPVVEIDGLFRGVLVAPGAFEVEMRFEPASIRNGMRISLAALAVWVVLWFVLTRRRRRPPLAPRDDITPDAGSTPAD